MAEVDLGDWERDECLKRLEFATVVGGIPGLFEQFVKGQMGKGGRCMNKAKLR